MSIDNILDICIFSLTIPRSLAKLGNRYWIFFLISIPWSNQENKAGSRPKFTHSGRLLFAEGYEAPCLLRGIRLSSVIDMVTIKRSRSQTLSTTKTSPSSISIDISNYQNGWSCGDNFNNSSWGCSLLKDQYTVLAEPFRVKLCICLKEPPPHPPPPKKKNHTPLYPIMHDGTTGLILVSDDSHEIIMTRLSG